MTLQHLFLCGPRGSGKTSVARCLGEALELPAIDLDEVVQTDAGRTIREIFEEGGEQVFRDYETVALQTTIQGPRAVIALGGGAVLRGKNREIISTSGRVVFLDASIDVLLSRVAGDDATADQRPALTNMASRQEMETLMAQRRPIYDALSNVRIDTSDRSPEEVAAAVKAELDENDKSHR